MRNEFALVCALTRPMDVKLLNFDHIVGINFAGDGLLN